MIVVMDRQSSWVKKCPMKDRKTCFPKTFFQKSCFRRHASSPPGHGRQCRSCGQCRFGKYWRCVVGDVSDKQTTAAVAYIGPAVSRSVTRPLKHLTFECLAVGKAWLNPRRRDQSSRVWSRVRAAGRGVEVRVVLRPTNHGCAVALCPRASSLRRSTLFDDSNRLIGAIGRDKLSHTRRQQVWKVLKSAWSSTRRRFSPTMPRPTVLSDSPM
jgi:hypothetical protein